jgi:hypothetical protein
MELDAAADAEFPAVGRATDRRANRPVQGG